MFIETTLQLMPTLAQTGPLVMQGLGLLAIVLGVMLWLLGKRLARPACAGLWVILGMLVTGAICKLMGDAGLLPVWLVAGGIVAGTIGWILYRVCLAMALAIVLGLAVPAVLHFSQVGMPPSQEISQNITQEVDRVASDSKAITDDVSGKASRKTDEIVDVVKDKTADAAQKLTNVFKQAVADATKKIAGSKEDATAAGDTDEKADEKSAGDQPPSVLSKSNKASDDESAAGESAADDADADDQDLLACAPSAERVMAVLRSMVQGPWEKLSALWQELSSEARRSLIGAAIIGSLAGFFLGLIFPRLGAAAGSSLLGTLFMAAGCITILTYYNPSILTRLDNQTSLCLMALGLITLMGIGIQWTLERRRTDN